MSGENLLMYDNQGMQRMRRPNTITKISQTLVLLIALLAFPLGAHATITVVGDLASGLSIDIYAFEGTAGGTNPCSGTGSSDSNLNIGGDTAYDDDDDYNVNWSPSASPIDVNIWFCDDAVKLGNFTKSALDSTTLTVDLGRIVGTSMHNDLDNDYIYVCTDINGTQLNSEEIQVAEGANNYTQYFGFQDDNSDADTDIMYVFLDDDTTNGCTWDTTKSTGREINANSAHAYENHGVAAEFAPETNAVGGFHPDLNSSTLRVWNTDQNTNLLNIGLLNFGVENNGGDDYNLFYDSNSAGIGKVDIVRFDDLLPTTFATHPDMNITGLTLNFTRLDVNAKVNGDVPVDIDEVRTTIDGNVFTTVSLEGTPTDYNLYLPGNQTPSVVYLDDSNIVFQYDYNAALNGTDTNKDIGVIRGDAHNALEGSANADFIEVFTDNACGDNADQASGDGVQASNDFNGSLDYNLYFVSSWATTYYLQTRFDDGNDSYNACGNALTLTTQIGTVDLFTRLYGQVDANLSTVGADTDSSGDGESDINGTVVGSKYNIFAGTGAGVTKAGLNDSNAMVFDAVGTVVLERTKDLLNTTDTNLVFNVGQLGGEAHAELETGSNDLFEVFSNTGCTTTLSSVDGIAADGAGLDWNVFFEADSGAPNDTNYYLLVHDVNTTDFRTCGNRFTLSDFNTFDHDIDRQITGTVHADVNKVGLDWTTADAVDDANTTDFSSGRYWLFTNDALAGASDDVRFYKNNNDTPVLVLSRTKDVASADLNVPVAKVSGEAHANMEADANDTVHVFTTFTPSTGNLATQVSSVDLNPANDAASDDYNQYFEPTKGSDGNHQYYLRVRANINGTAYDTNGNTFTVGAGLAATVNLTVDQNGTVVTDIDRAAVDLNGVEAEASADVNSNVYHLFTVVDGSGAADTNYYRTTTMALGEILDLTSAGTVQRHISQITGVLPNIMKSDTLFIAKSAVYTATCDNDLDDKNGDLAADATGDYNLYYVADGADYNVNYCDGSTLLLTRLFTSDATGNDIVVKNIAGIGGEAHNLLEGTPSSTVAVARDANCLVQLSTVTVNPADAGDNDYNQYFDANSGAAATYYLDLNARNDYRTCQTFTGGTPATFQQHDLSVQLSGLVPEGVARINVDKNAAFTTDFNSNDSNRYFVYVGPSTTTTTVWARGDNSEIQLQRTRDLSADANFNVSRVQGTSHADLNSHSGDNLDVYYASTCTAGTRVSSEDINFPSGGTFIQYYDSNFDNNIFVQVANNNGDYDLNTCLNTGISDSNGLAAERNVNRRIQGVVGGNINSVNVRFNADTYSPDANQTPRTALTPDIYQIYLSSDTDVNVLFFQGSTLRLNLGKDASSDINVHAGYATGDVHAGAIGGTVEVFSGNTCATTLTSSIPTTADSGLSDYDVYFDASSNTAFYAVLQKIQTSVADLNTCTLGGFTLTDMNNTTLDFNVQIAGTVPSIVDAALSNVVRSVGVDLNNDDAIDYIADVNGTVYYLYVDGNPAGDDDNVVFFQDTTATTALLMRNKNIDGDVNVDVGAIKGEAHGQLEDSSDVIDVCSQLPAQASFGSCIQLSSANVEPADDGFGTNDFEIFYDFNGADTNTWLQIVDSNGANPDMNSYHRVRPTGAGTVTDVNLLGILEGIVVESYDSDVNIADVNILGGVGTGTGSSADITGDDFNMHTFSNNAGLFTIYGALSDADTTSTDLLFKKGGYITESFDNNSFLANMASSHSQTDGNFLYVNMDSGIIVRVLDPGGGYINDATVTVLDSKNPDVILTGCTSPSGDCQRTATNNDNNEYTFSGFTLPATVAIKVEKTGYDTVVSPVFAGQFWNITTTENLDINITLADSAPQAVSLNNPADGATVSNSDTLTLEWYDLNVDEVDYNFQLASVDTFTSGIVRDHNMGGNADNNISVILPASTLTDGTTYYWRVRARDVSGWGAWSATRSLVVDSSAPTSLAVTINDNNAYANSLAATLSVSASGATDCTFANDTDMDNSATDENFSNEHDFNNVVSWNLDGNTNGVKRVFMQCRNDANAWAGPVSDTITVDSVAPEGLSITIEDGNAYASTVTVDIALAADNASLCQISNDSNNWTTQTCNTTVDNWAITTNSVGDGLKTVYLRATDPAGNQTEAFDTILLDTNAPETAPGSLTAADSNKQVRLTWTAGEDLGSGIDYYNIYRNTTGTFTPGAANRISSGTTELEYTDAPGVTGTYFYTVRAVDKAGNEETNTAEASVTIDLNAPTDLNIVIADGNTYVTTRAVTIDNSANGSSTCEYSTDGSTWTAVTCNATDTAVTLSAGEGVKTVFFRANDGNNNVTQVSDAVIFDETPPTSVQGVSATITANQVVLAWGATVDGVSGLASYSVYRSDSNGFTPSASTLVASGQTGLQYTDSPTLSGTYYYVIGARNNAGLEDANGMKVVADLDINAPTNLSVIIDDDNLYSITMAVDVTTSLTGGTACQLSNFATDWTDVTCNTTVSWTLDGNFDGIKTVYFRASDGNSNLAATVTDTILLDRNAPGDVTAAVDATVDNNTTVRITWTGVNDSNSGLDYYEVLRGTSSGSVTTQIGTSTGTTFDHKPGDGRYHYAVRAIDKAGNVGTNANTVNASLDSAAPTGLAMVINQGDLYTKVASVTATHQASGVGSGACDLDEDGDFTSGATVAAASGSTAFTLTGSDGSKFLYYRCNDENGNIATAVFDTIVLDTAGPTTPTVVSPTSDTNSGSSFTWQWASATDSNSGVAGYQVQLFRGGTAVRDSNTGTATYYTDTNLDIDGNYDLNVRAFDNAGNYGSWLEFDRAVVVDTSAPSVSSIVNPTSDTDSNKATDESNGLLDYNVAVSGQTTSCKFQQYRNGTYLGSGQDVTVSPTSAGRCNLDVSSANLGAGNELGHGNSYYAEVQVRDNVGNWSPLVRLPTVTIDTNSPTVVIVSPTADSNISDVTPRIVFDINDDSAGELVLSRIQFDGNVTGFNSSSDCNATDSPRSYRCAFNNTTSMLDPSTQTIGISVEDKAGNGGQATGHSFRVDGNDTITLNVLTETKTTGSASNTYPTGWQFDFNITLGTTAGDKVRFKMNDWKSGSNSIAVRNNARMVYDANKSGTRTTEFYPITNDYNLSIDVNTFWDTDTSTTAIDGNFYIQQKIPTATVAGNYSTTYAIRSYQ